MSVSRSIRASRRQWKRAMKFGASARPSWGRRRGTYPTTQDAAEGAGRFAMAGRVEPYRSPAPSTAAGTKAGKRTMVPRYVSTADIADFTTSQKIQHEDLRKRFVRIQQAGMGVPGPKGTPRKGAIVERW